MLALRTLSRAVRTAPPPHQSAFHLTRASARPSPKRFLGPPTPSPPSHTTSHTTTAVVGLASGTLGSLCGVGGAIFSIPFLIRYTSLPQRTAAGNSLIAVTGIALTSAYTFSQADHVDVETATVLGTTAAFFTPLGARLSSHCHPVLLRRGLGVFMLALAPLMPLRSVLEQGAKVDIEERNAVIGTAGSAVGFVSGLLGISGGSLFTPLVALVGDLGSFRTALGTSFAAMVFPTAIGAAAYARMGCVQWKSVAPLVGGGMVGATFGSALALNVPEEVLRWGFAMVFFAMGLRVIRAPIKADRRVTNARTVVGIQS